MNRLTWPLAALSLAGIVALCLAMHWTPSNGWQSTILGSVWALVWVLIAIRTGKRQGGDA